MVKLIFIIYNKKKYRTETFSLPSIFFMERKNSKKILIAGFKREHYYFIGCFINKVLDNRKCDNREKQIKIHLVFSMTQILKIVTL